MATACYDAKIRIWDWGSDACVKAFTGSSGGNISSLAFSPDGRTLASASTDSAIRIWDPGSGTRLKTLRIDPESTQLSALAVFSPDGRTLASASKGDDDSIRIWNPISGTCLKTLNGHSKSITSLIFGPNGRMLASAGDDKTVRIWDPESGRCLKTFTVISSVLERLALGPDGRTLALSTPNEIRIWDLSQDDFLCKYVPKSGTAIVNVAKTNPATPPVPKINSTPSPLQNTPPTTPLISQESPSKPSATNRPVADKWALVVGISHFKNPQYDLKFASKDALDFYNYLVNEANFRKDHVLLLLDSKATKNNIMSAFGDRFLPAVAQPDDLVVVFISTHGTPKNKDQGKRNYIVAHDTNANELYTTGVNMDELYARVKEAVNTDRALIVMDTCYSGGGIPGAKAMADSANFDANEIAQGCGHLVVTSSAPNERSWESTVSPNGVFTKYLLQALRGNKGDLKKAFSDVQTKVSWEVKSAFNAAQSPQLGGNWEGKDLLLAVPARQPRELFNKELLDLMRTSVPSAANSAKNVGAPKSAPTNRHQHSNQ